ncbi:hypothetical protein ACLOJK_013562 [Asimina triloba]
MVTRNADASSQQGDSSVSTAHPHPHPHPVSAEQLRSHAGNTVTGLSASNTDNTTHGLVFKSGPLLVSSKGLLASPTTSLYMGCQLQLPSACNVHPHNRDESLLQAEQQTHSTIDCCYGRSNRLIPQLIVATGGATNSFHNRSLLLQQNRMDIMEKTLSAAAQKGSEANLTLGGIDLNNSASVVVKAEKKLITVLFPDGRDGRAFTLKAESSEDLYEWKNALEVALAQAPGATSSFAVEQSGIFQNEAADAIEVSFEQWNKRPVKSSIIGRPVLYALEDADGSPSFLEKALRFMEQYGVKVEGILRQAADVDDVERRVQDFEQGKNEFSPDEDAHVIADCIKHVLRELPSSPVPASCCTSLLEAFSKYQFRLGTTTFQVNALHDAISKTFPEPNRQLLQSATIKGKDVEKGYETVTMLKMMQTVVHHKSENRMSTSAVAACMAPLLLRPLLAGDCEVENDFNMGGDGSLQLLRAAAAANHAQAIIITLLEEYRNIFPINEDNGSLQDGSASPELYSESEGSGSEFEGSTDDETLEDDGYEGAENEIEGESEDDHEHSLSRSSIENSDDDSGDLNDNKAAKDVDSESSSPKIDKDSKVDDEQANDCDAPHHHQDVPTSGSLLDLSDHPSASVIQCSESLQDTSPTKLSTKSTKPSLESTGHSQSLCIPRSRSRSNESVADVKRRYVLGRVAAKKNLSMESIDFPEDEHYHEKGANWVGSYWVKVDPTLTIFEKPCAQPYILDRVGTRLTKP